MKTRFLKSALALAVFGAAAAQAQMISQISQTYVPISGGTVVNASQFVPRDTYPGIDEGYFALNLGFTFPFYGNNYSTAYIDSNGFITFGSPCTDPSSCLVTRRIPQAASTFHNILAPWFADMDGATTGRVTYKLSANQAEIEWSNWEEWGSFGYDLTMKVILTSSGMIQIHYGSLDFPSATGSRSSAGLENADGTQGVAILACSATAGLCSPSDWPANTLFTIGRPNQADLLVPSVTISNLVSNMGHVTFNFAGTIENYGLTAANNFDWKVYLSTDQTLSMDDVLVYSSTAPASLAASSSISVSGAAATPGTIPTGQYYVLIQADSANTVNMEASELNNVGSTQVPFIQGLDLVASTVSGPSLSGPGNNMTTHVKFFNQGADPAGVVTYEILLSSDNTYSTNDYVLYTGTKSLSGGETVDQDVTFSVPSSVPGGEFFYLLRIDPQNIRTEANEMNNVVASTAKITMQQAELVNLGVSLLDGVTGAPTNVANLGQLVQMSVRMQNTGGADAKNFRVVAGVSTDGQFSLLFDTRVHEFTVASLAAGETRTETFSFTLPLNDRNGAPFTTGNYFMFAALDWTGVVNEVNEQNNNLAVPGYVLLRSPAPDLTVTRLEIPASAAVGETVPVYRTIKNVGNVTAPEAKYRFVLSANPIITADDLPLTILGNNGGTASYGLVTLGIGQSDTTTELVRLPSQMTPGTYYVGCLVDTDGTVAELDEQNNAWAGNQVNVSASSLRVSTQQLADAMVDRPYAFRLVAMGEQGPSTWTLESGAGDLPTGLTLSSEGLLTGTPTMTGVYGFNVVLQNASRSTTARLLLRVLPPSAEVEVTTVAVPPVVNSQVVAYSVALGAAGGVRPYKWKLASGNLPLGLTLSEDGVVGGSPRSGQAEGVFRVSVEVKDALGSKARRELNFRLVAPGSIIFGNPVVPDGLVNGDYLADIVVRNADGSALAKPLSWSLVGGALPDGLALTVEADVALLSGKPLVAGTFQFSLQVEDAKGRSVTADFVMTVHPARFKIVALNMPTRVHPAESVDFSLSAGANVLAQFSVFAGSLPKGLTVGADGHVTGTVADENSEGTFSFVIEARDAAGASGLGAFSLEVERDVTKAGCSTTGGGLGVGLFGLLLSMARRRRARHFALAASAAVVLPLVAMAQATGYQLAGPFTASFVSIGTTGAVVPGITSFSGGTVNLPFGFSFYGQSTMSIGVSPYGYLYWAGDDVSANNIGIPHNDSSTFSAPQTFIAPWWDSYSSIGTAPSSIRFQVRGAAPQREAVIEWVNMQPLGSSTRISFQASLFEGTNAIRFSYGTTAPQASSASVGIQRAINEGVSGLSCTTTVAGNCGALNWPAGQALEFFLPPDLSMGVVSGDQAAYSGVNYRATAVVRNQGGHKATNVSVRFYLSTNPTLEVSDILLGDAMSVDVEPYAQVTASMIAPVPNTVMQGTYFLLAQVDPDNLIAEQSESNNFGSPAQISVNAPAPDLLVASVSGPAATGPEGMVTVSRTLANYGNAAAGPFKYTYYLSDNDVVTVSDTAISPVKALGGLAANATDTGMDTLALPAGLSVGRYWLGVCVNYDPTAVTGFGIDEISRVNNCTTATTPIIISRGELLVLTNSLPGASQFAPYSMHLAASGGNGQYSWSLAGGELPVGMTLSSTGDLSGSPAQAKTYGFSVKVTSGGVEATAELSLAVSSGSLPLAVVDQVLPSAEFSRAYSTRLIAVGGKPTYRWQLKDGAKLPEGLALATDGLVEGRASASGQFDFAVTVKDTAGIESSKELSIRVVEPSSLHVATSRLPVGSVKQQYSHKLQAVGGKQPYTWSVTRVQREAENPTEAPGKPLETFPEGFGLSIEARANNEAFLAGVPLMAGLYRVALKVKDATGAEDSTTVLLQVSYDEGLAIVTTELPDAFVDRGYEAALTVNLKDATGLKFSTPCVQQPVVNHIEQFECAEQDAKQPLPPGLTLDETTGKLSGTPTAQTFVKSPKGDIEPVVYSFLVGVTDSLGRQDLRGLSIRVRPDYKAAGGCGCGVFEPSALGLLAALGLMLRNRKRRNAAHV